jgi:hypothetical protein
VQQTPSIFRRNALAHHAVSAKADVKLELTTFWTRGAYRLLWLAVTVVALAAWFARHIVREALWP